MTEPDSTPKGSADLGAPHPISVDHADPFGVPIGCVEVRGVSVAGATATPGY